MFATAILSAHLPDIFENCVTIARKKSSFLIFVVLSETFIVKTVARSLLQNLRQKCSIACTDRELFGND